MTKLNFNHLSYFRVIAREGSIKKATHVLHVTQPTLSDQLRQLEEAIGRKLFHRQNRGLVLTDYGKTVLEYTNEIFSLANEMLRKVQSKGMADRETIDLGIVPSLSKALTFKIFSPIFEQEQFRIRIREGDLGHLLSELDMRNLDLVLTDYKPRDLRSAFEQAKIGKVQYCAVAGPKYRAAKKAFPASLAGIPFFNYTSNSPIHREIDRLFAQYQITPEVVAEADDLNFVRVGALKNKGFAILPHIAIEEFVAEGKLHILGEIPEMTSPVYAIWPSRHSKQSLSNVIHSIINDS